MLSNSSRAEAFNTLITVGNQAAPAASSDVREEWNNVVGEFLSILEV